VGRGSSCIQVSRYYFVVFHMVSAIHKYHFRFLIKRTTNCQNGGRSSEPGRCGCKFTDDKLKSCDLTVVCVLVKIEN
jgi:hypothetical protein